MAAILSNTKPHCHARSISLPSISGQEPEFSNLNTIQASKEATTSTSLMCGRLSRLNDMYGSIEPLLALPATKNSLVQRCHKEELTKSLDEIVLLLDLCTTTRDVLSMSMDASKELQSVLRRKRRDHHNLSSLVEKYLSQRKHVKKTVCKALSGLQKQTSSSNKEDHKITPDINILKEMRLETLTMFESLLTFFLGSEAELKQKGWFLFSKMVGYKRVQCDLIVLGGHQGHKIPVVSIYSLFICSATQAIHVKYYYIAPEPDFVNGCWVSGDMLLNVTT